MSTPSPSTGGEKAAHLLTLASSVFLCGALLWPALASGAHQGWPLTLTQLLVLAALLSWVLGMLIARRLEWRPTALDLPLLLLAALICVQLIIGNGALARWALAPPPGDPAQAAALPTPFFSIGTVSGAQTAQSLLVFLTYAAVYVLVVNLLRRRSQLDRLVQTLLLFGGALAFVALIDYLARDSWLLWWREGPRLARLTGPFVNPDHFATWLVMLTCLGAGYVAARRASGRPGLRWREMLRSRAEREAAIRRDLPAVGVALTLLAALFTLSRGALLSLAVALLAALAVRKRTGRIGGWTLLVGALAATTVGGAIWIGLDPLVARLGETDHVKRWLQWTSTMPMLGAFPLFGVGLGAYKDIFFRYQPAVLEPGRVYFPYAHNDLLQFVVETGPLGAALLCFAIWRVGRDLVGAHLLGQGSCPVGGGAGRDAQRHHAFSVAIALGALAAVFAVMIHSLLDFSARIPADGILAAACLGIATVALHTRFTAEGDEDLSPVRARALTGRIVPLGAAAALAALALAWVAARPALVETQLAGVTGAGALARADRAVGVDARNIRARRMRAELRLDAAREIWRNAPTDETARARAAGLVAGAVEDLRTAIGLRPTEPFLHERLAVASATAAVLEPARAVEHRARSLSHLARAIALAPEDPLLYLTEAVVAASGPGARLELGLGAAREAVQRDPTLLPELVDRFLPLRLGPAQWLAAIPVSTVDRLQLGDLLERRGVLEEAGEIYSRAVETATGPEAPLAHWILARWLLRTGNLQTAARQAEAGLARDPDNPELLLARADALSGLSKPSALAAYEGALRAAEAQEVKGTREPFGALIENARLRALVAQRLEGSPRTQPLRYQRALARYLTDQRMWSPSLVEWERVLAQSPDDALGHFSRGLALDASGNPDQAIDEYRKAVSLDDHNSAYRRRLAQRLWDTEQFYQAINEWRSLTGLQPANIETRLSLARAFVRVGERSEASREYEQILALAPGHPEARQALGRLRHTP
jgi:tetratricopeptide (TPR) repeat protein/O-antigen ligase